MTDYTPADAKRDDLMTDAIEEMETEDEYNRHESHDERPDLDGCWLCRRDFDEAVAEHAWMSTAVKSWSGGNPYAPINQDEMEALRRMK
jgi:hypothetical protein